MLEEMSGGLHTENFAEADWPGEINLVVTVRIMGCGVSCKGLRELLVKLKSS